MAYGYDTKSWRNSTEKKQLDRERAAATAKYESEHRDTIEVQPQCNCDVRPYSHDPVFFHQQTWPLVWSRA